MAKKRTPSVGLDDLASKHLGIDAHCIVERVPDQPRKLQAVLNHVLSAATRGIIYVAPRKHAEDLAELLAANGHRRQSGRTQEIVAMYRLDREAAAEALRAAVAAGAAEQRGEHYVAV